MKESIFDLASVYQRTYNRERPAKSQRKRAIQRAIEKQRLCHKLNSHLPHQFSSAGGVGLCFICGAVTQNQSESDNIARSVRISVRPGYQDAASSTLRPAWLLSSHFLVLTVKTSDKFSHCCMPLNARSWRLIINVIFSPAGVKSGFVLCMRT